MTKKLIAGIGMLAFVMFACKKTLPDTPLPVSGETAYYPPGYNPSVKNKKSYLGATQGSISDIVIDSADKKNAFIIGNFLSINGNPFKGICRFNGVTNTFSSYQTNINFGYTYNIRSFAQYNGNHYLGGIWFDNIQSHHYFGHKSPANSTIIYDVEPNDFVNTMKVQSGNLYISGDFTGVNTIGGYISPLFCINNPTQYYGSQTFTSYDVTKMAYYNSNWILASPIVNGYLLASGGGNWNLNYGGGFDSQITDMDVFANKLYAAGYMSSSNSFGTALNYVNYLNTNTNTWEKVGANNLPGPCLDIEYYNNTLYACGNSNFAQVGYFYYLDATSNQWKSYVASSITVHSYPHKMAFLNGKILLAEGIGLYLYQ
ncbi:MAG: hypothetical protein IT236_10895 [Bacteroidia bacterium]|nr:hypothetical protein [Bacteroidia bacterium]